MASALTEQRTLPVAAALPPPAMSVNIGLHAGSEPSSVSSSSDLSDTTAARRKSTQAPILEEDECTASGSESTEPITPTSDGNHPFHHRDAHAVDHHTPAPYAPPGVAMKSLPIRARPSQSETSQPPPSSDAPSQPPPTVDTALPHPPSQPRTSPTQSSSDETPPTPKDRLSKRVGSFVKNRLGRSSSSKSKGSIAPDPPVDSSVPSGDSGADTPPVEMAPPRRKSKRIGSFSFSARTSPFTSKTNSGTNTPPSPTSPVITPLHGDRVKKLEKSRTFNSLAEPEGVPTGARLDRMQSPRHGVTWGAGGPRPSGAASLQVPRVHRRRSASTDHIPRVHPPADDSDESDPTDGLRISYSKRAVEGTGLKARRLSTSLPDEFWVDYCELDKEFKSSSFFPGRRGQLVGKGATATVTLMQRRGGSKDELYAVKEFRGKDKAEDDDEYIQKVKSEFSIAKSLNHPNIVETVRLCVQNGRWNHVMEYCAVGELYTLVERGLFRTHYRLEDRLCFFKQVARGIEYLHRNGIAHRDIKLENLLMTSEGHIKITDFGVSEVFSGEHPGLRQSGGQCGKNMGEVRRCAPGICGSLPYIAPEVLAKIGDYDPRPLDVWSCAIVFLTMTYSGSPWQAAKPEYPLYAKFSKGWSDWLETNPDGQIHDGPNGTPKCGVVFNRLDTAPLKRLMLRMLHPDPEKRISMADVLRTGVMKSVDCCAPESFDEPEPDAMVDAACAKTFRVSKVVKKHHHLPPREHRTPRALRHRFDMGDGYS